MQDTPLHDDGTFDDDPELRAAMTAAFGEDAAHSFIESESESTTGTETLEALIGRLDEAMQSLDYARVTSKAEIKDAATTGSDPRFVVFETAGQLAALPLSGIAEIERIPAYTPLPRTPPWCLGIANIRGQIVSVTDLAALVGTERSVDLTGQKVVITHSPAANATTALVVDRVIGIRSFRESVAHQSDELKAPLAQFSDSMARLDSEHVLLINPDQLFSHGEMQPFMTQS